MEVSLNTPEPIHRERLGVGPIVAIVLLIAVFAAGGVYFFVREKARLSTPPVVETVNT